MTEAVGRPCLTQTALVAITVPLPLLRRCQPAAHAAAQLDLSLAEVYESLSYYYAHIDEMCELERENEAAFEHLRDSSLMPKETVQ